MQIKILIIIFSFVFFSYKILANDDLTGKNLLCADIFWGFEFKSSKKVRVINTDINKKTSTREYFYETDSKLPYINIYLIQNNIKDLIYSIHRKDLRVDIWTMTSGGNTTREMIPEGFCKNSNIVNILMHIERLKSI